MASREPLTTTYYNGSTVRNEQQQHTLQHPAHQLYGASDRDYSSAFPTASGHNSTYGRSTASYLSLHSATPAMATFGDASATEAQVQSRNIENNLNFRRIQRTFFDSVKNTYDFAVAVLNNPDNIRKIINSFKVMELHANRT